MNRLLIYFLLTFLLLVTVALLGDRSGYEFPARGLVTIDQARLMTPISLAQRAISNQSFENLQKPIHRFGLFDDAGLAIIIAVQIFLAGYGIILLRRPSMAR